MARKLISLFPEQRMIIIW